MRDIRKNPVEGDSLSVGNRPFKIDPPLPPAPKGLVWVWAWKENEVVLMSPKDVEDYNQERTRPGHAPELLPVERLAEPLRASSR